MLFLITILLASQSFLAALGGPIDPKQDLKSLCKNESVSITNVDQLKSLADQLKLGDEPECNAEFAQALKELDDITQAGSKNVCDESVARGIQSFYLDGLDLALPDSLRSFFFSYAMRASQICKKNMIEQLTGKANDLLEPKDFEAIAHWAGKDGELAEVLKGIAATGRMILPSDLMATLPANFEVNYQLSQYLANSDVSNDIQLIKKVCMRRFTPVYKSIVAPVAELSRFGFDYSYAAIRSELTINQEQADKLDEWARVVYLCEAMNIIATVVEEVDDSKFEQVNYEPSPKNILTLEPISDEELERLKAGTIRPETSIDHLREEIHKTATKIMTDYMKKHGPESVPCLDCEQEEENDMETIAGDHDRQLSGGWRGRKQYRDRGLISRKTLKKIRNIFLVFIIVVVWLMFFAP